MPAPLFPPSAESATRGRYAAAARATEPALWSGYHSGAYIGANFLEAFRAAEFLQLEMLTRSEDPLLTVNGIEFRSVTVRAWKTVPRTKSDLTCCGTQDACC
jgi:hypothetical protein